MSDEAAALLRRNFPGVAPDRVPELAKRIEFAADLHKTAVPTDSRNADRLADITRVIKHHLPEWDRLFADSYPDLMADVCQMCWRERRLATSVWALGTRGPPYYIFVFALLEVYREASGKEPWATVDRGTGRVVPNEFTKFIIDAFRTLCDGEPPSLDTIRRAVAKAARAGSKPPKKNLLHM